MALATRDQSAAHEHAGQLVALSATHGDKRRVRTYVIEHEPDGLGRCRTYYVDFLPPPDTKLVQVFDTWRRERPNGLSAEYVVEEIPV